MEKLSRNHPRFCAKYRRFVGEFEHTSKYFPVRVEVNGEAFSRLSHKTGMPQPGDLVYLACRIPAHHGQPKKWRVHLIELPEAYWGYEAWHQAVQRGQRVAPRKAYAQTWFGSSSVLLEKN